MITQFSLKNFKCFKNEQEFDFSSINLFTGYNGRGKSSVIQALLLLSQSMKRDPEMRTLCINGDFVALDLFEDILNDQQSKVSFSVKTDNLKLDMLQLDYECNKNNERIGKLSDILVDEKTLLSTTQGIKNDDLISETKRFNRIPVEGIELIFNNFYFISADRLGPTRYEEKTELQTINPIGTNGQFKLNFLKNNPSLMDEICKNIRYIMDCEDSLSITGTGNEYSVLSLTFDNPKKKIKAFNTGFGYTYILAILLLINSVSEGCIFIENPEAHLHPLAQSRLMELVCEKLSDSKKLQIFIETHSEHIINAVRLQVVKKENNIDTDNVKIYFFDRDFTIKKLTINQRGQIPNWPVGFFDQQTVDLQNIIKLGLKDES